MLTGFFVYLVQTHSLEEPLLNLQIVAIALGKVTKEASRSAIFFAGLCRQARLTFSVKAKFQRDDQTFTSRLSSRAHCRNEIYFLRFFSRDRSSLIDIVGSFLLSSINFQNVEEV